MDPNAQRSMIGLATTRRTMSSAAAGSMARPELDPASGRGDLHRHPELGGGVHQGGRRAVGDPGEIA